MIRASRRRGRTALVALATALAASACDAPGSDRVLVAVAAGVDFLSGARLALHDELERGPIPGLDTILIAEPTNRADVALIHAEDLAAHDGIAAVIGHGNSTASLAAARAYNAHEIVQIAPTSTTPAYSLAGPFSFRMVPSDEAQGRYLAEAIAGAFPDGARLAVFYVNDDYGRGLREHFLAGLDTTTHPIVVDLPHLQEEFGGADVENAVAALEETRPDVVMWLGRPTTLSPFLPALRRVLGEVPVYGGDALGADGSVTGSDSWRGVIYSDFVDPLATDELRGFDARIREVSGDPAGAPDILSYDATRLVLAALRDGARTGPEIRDWLRSLGRERPPHRGLAGPITFDERGDVERSFVTRAGGPGAVSP